MEDTPASIVTISFCIFTSLYQLSFYYPWLARTYPTEDAGEREREREGEEEEKQALRLRFRHFGFTLVRLLLPFVLALSV